MTSRGWSSILALSWLLLLPAFKVAHMQLPNSLASATQSLKISGHNPRTWNRPFAFGDYKTTTVREGGTYSWSARAFGVTTGVAEGSYRMVLAGPDGESWEIECLARTVEAWRNGWTIDLTDAFSPRLICGFNSPSRGHLRRLVLGMERNKLHGLVQDATNDQPLFGVHAVYHLEGARFPSGDPVGYLLDRSEAPVAAVETINKGRVWLGPQLSAEDRGLVAATIAALLLFDPEISPQP